MADRFNPRNIPARAHYDRLMTWATSVIGRLDATELAELQRVLVENAKEAIAGTDDDRKIFAVLAELGFCAILDNMADIIESKLEARKRVGVLEVACERSRFQFDYMAKWFDTHGEPYPNAGSECATRRNELDAALNPTPPAKGGGL